MYTSDCIYRSKSVPTYLCIPFVSSYLIPVLSISFCLFYLTNYECRHLLSFLSTSSYQNRQVPSNFNRMLKNRFCL